MGTWGDQPFDGDVYLDYIIKLERDVDPYYLLRKTLIVANLEEQDNSQGIYEAYTAVGIVATALGLDVGKYGGQPKEFLERPEIKSISHQQWLSLLPLALRVTVILLDERSGVYKANIDFSLKRNSPIVLEEYVQVRSDIQYQLLRYAASVKS